MGVQYCKAIDIADGGWNFAQGGNFFFVGNPHFKDCLAFAFQLAKQIQHEFLEILYLEFGFSS